MTARVRELTPRGSGGVSVIEVSGPRTLERLASLLSRPGLAPGKLSLVRLALAGEELDEALVWCESPSRAELHLHGSPALVRRVGEELARAGFEPWSAAPGPRALEERARELLPRAPCEAGARMLLDQQGGALRSELERAARLRGEARRACLLALAARARAARFLLEPARVVLAGVVNAGKSTLFNALVGSERALVTDEPGTTRDVLCEAAHLGAYPVLLFDTAGERALAPESRTSGVEAEGQALGARARASADVVLWLRPADAPSPRGPAGSIEIVTRCDLAASASAHDAAARVAAGPEPRAAADAVARLVLERLSLPERAWEPGAGVPFEPWMEASLEQAAREQDPALLAQIAADR